MAAQKAEGKPRRFPGLLTGMPAFRSATVQAKADASRAPLQTGRNLPQRGR